MVDTETFLTILDVMVDECCPSHFPPAVHPGPQASLRRSEVITLGLGGQGACCPSQRACSRSAPRHRRVAVPTRPHRTQVNRLWRQHYTAIVAYGLHLVGLLAGRPGRYDALDGTAVPTREAKRRGAGWLPGLADSGWSTRLGWDDGCHRRLAVNPRGLSTGCGVGPASAQDPPLAEPFFAWRRPPHPGGLRVGKPALGPYLCAQGCAGQTAHRRWWPGDGAPVLCPPKRNSRRPWSTRRRRWLAGVRQSVEPVYDTVPQTFGLSRARPHDLTGLQARLAAKVARHNFCVWLNEPLGRPGLAVADLIEW
jgi:hypothetical protein